MRAIMKQLARWMVIVGGCAIVGLVGAAQAAQPAIPPNYRQLVAAKLRQWEDVRAVRSAEISRPYERFLGLINGGTRVVVCVSLMRPNAFGSIATFYYLFYFNNGQADGFKQGASNFFELAQLGCGNQPMTKFTEFAKSR